MGRPHRETVVTIRVDSCLADMLKSVPNRSAFIRDAIRDALARQCPVCHGAGVVAVADPSETHKAPAKQTEQPPASET